MSCEYLLEVGENFKPESDEKLMPSLFKEYERVIVESIVTSFGLDFIIADQHGGDVDTIHNVRQIGTDKLMDYKNSQNSNDYENVRYDYNNGSAYRSNKEYKARGASDKVKQHGGNLEDLYRGKTMQQNEKRQLDHVISASEVHKDRGRVLSSLDGIELANQEENLQSTHGYINRIKSDYTTQEFLDDVLPKQKIKLQNSIEKDKAKLEKMPNATPEEQHKRRMLEANIRKNEENVKTLESIDEKAMLKADKKARDEYNRKLNTAYYTSSKFALDTAKAAGSVGMKMGARQVLGFVFAEMWFAVKEEFSKVVDEFDFKSFLKAIANGVKRGYENAKKKYKELFDKFLSGALAGALSSITTTICNIFFTTAKNIVKILRQTYASLVEALKILVFNPENYSFGDRLKAVTKILATGASIVVGTLIAESISKTPIATIPGIGDIVQSFIGAFVTGIMTCTLLYYLDNSPTVAKLVNWLNKIQTVDADLRYYQEQAKFFEKYAAELMDIDLEQFKKEVAMYSKALHSLENAKSPSEVNTSLRNTYKVIGITIPWEGDFDTFMADKSKKLIFS